MSEAIRGPALLFKSDSELKRMSLKVPVFIDESHISAFTDGAKPPWTPEVARVAAQLIQEAPADDERFADGKEFRFIVGKVGCKGVEVYRKLVASAAMCSAYKIALLSNPSEHGAAPWVTLSTECDARNGGLVKGPAGAIVGASRDQTYLAAAQAAIMAFNIGASGLTGEESQELLKLCQAAGARCPLDTKKITAAIAARRVEAAVDTVRTLGAGHEDVDALCTALATIDVWGPLINLKVDPQLEESSRADVAECSQVLRTHHQDSYSTALKDCEAERKALLATA